MNTFNQRQRVSLITKCTASACLRASEPTLTAFCTLTERWLNNQVFLSPTAAIQLQPITTHQLIGPVSAQSVELEVSSQLGAVVIQFQHVLCITIRVEVV